MSSPPRWSSAAPDFLAFATGLAVAYALRWTTTDLVWSLWLSSLVVGYGLIVWSILEPALELAGLGWMHRAEVEQSLTPTSGKQLAVMLAVVLVGGALYLAFFTVHFGGFHFIQSQFLLSSYPLGFAFHSMNRATFAEVVRRYWGALPSALLARRHAFMQRTFTREATPEQKSGASFVDQSAAKRSPMDELSSSRVAGPYLQVMRMHVVIILFGAIRAVHRESFLAYTLIYALYFFPWRLVRAMRRYRAASAAALSGLA